MKFKRFHNDYFSSEAGAYSRVTGRENYDSQITLTDVEADMVINHFGYENIQIGNVGSNKEKASKTFHLFPDYEPIQLNLVFPKPEKTELRLYISSRAGFKPPAGNIWFIFKRNGVLCIGSIPESEWNSLNQMDDLDYDYQGLIELSMVEGLQYDVDPGGKILTQNVGSRIIFSRDPRLARMRFDLASNRCEIDASHTTFIAQRTQLPYVEAHHFIPIKYQHLFDTPLDNLTNIISLCPNCHRGIHHAVVDHKYDLITDIYSKRTELHSTFSVDDIAQFYNAIRITD